MRPLAVAACSLSLLLACAAPRERVPGGDPSLPFSNAVRVGDTVWVAGHLGLDPETGHAPDDPAEEAERMLDAFEATLQRAGASMADLVRVQVFCIDVELYDRFNAVYRARFDGDFPARAFVGSGTLLRGARFEILGTAVVDAR